MIEHVGDLAALEGHVIIVHGVNGGWGHGPKFDAGFADELRRREPLIEASYAMAPLGYAPYRERIYAAMAPTNASGRYGEGWPAADQDGLPLGWPLLGELEGGEVVIHGVTQRSIWGWRYDLAKEPEPVPAVLWAVVRVLAFAVAHMRRLAALEGRARAIHMPRIGCGLGGLDWETQVRPAVETAERTRNEILPGASPHYSEAVTKWPAEFNVWTKAPGQAQQGEG